MISPADIRLRAETWWSDGSLLRSWLAGRSFCPQPLTRIRPENPATVVEQYARIQDEQQALRAGSRDVLGYGYSLAYTEYHPRSMGTVTLITGITFETDTDLLRYLNRETDAARFMTLASQTRQQVPELEPWLEKYPLRLLDNASEWPNWLTICRYFRDVYEPDCYYVRQLPLPVHTKFLEAHAGLLIDLLTCLKPDLLRPDQKDWRKRLGLLVPEPMIRIRVGPASRLDGKHEDFGLPLSAFAWHVQPAKRIVICENLLNFLTFPLMPDAVVVWSGGGFNIECLAEVAWLGEKEIVYWGDLDAHGFQMLNQCKGYFPNTHTLLMDQATVDHHRYLVGPGEKTTISYLPHLTDTERALFDLLKRNNWRIEQERLDWAWVMGAVGEMMQD